MCFRCIYGCPTKAMWSKNFMVLKGGFSLLETEKRMCGVKLKPVSKCSKGCMWSGVRKYLLDIDGY